MKENKRKKSALVYDDAISYTEYKEQGDNNNSTWLNLHFINHYTFNGILFLEFYSPNFKENLETIKAIVDRRSVKCVLNTISRINSYPSTKNIAVRVLASKNESYKDQLIVTGMELLFQENSIEHEIEIIRIYLKSKKLFLQQRSLVPKKFSRILVVCPYRSKAIADFEECTSVLQQMNALSISYAHAPFNSENSANIIKWLIEENIESAHRSGEAFDAVVLIRGGGTTEDLGFLNNIHLAEYICRLPIPVLSGIGHTNDQTIIDDIAFQSVGTPSYCGLVLTWLAANYYGESISCQIRVALERAILNK